MATLALTPGDYVEAIPAGTDGEIYVPKAGGTVLVETSTAKPAAGVQGIPLTAQRVKAYNMSGSAKGVWVKPVGTVAELWVNTA